MFHEIVKLPYLIPHKHNKKHKQALVGILHSLYFMLFSILCMLLLTYNEIGKKPQRSPERSHKTANDYEFFIICIFHICQQVSLCFPCDIQQQQNGKQKTMGKNTDQERLIASLN